MQKRWELLPAHPAGFLSEIGVDQPVIGQLLWNRGLKTKEEAQAFFEPDWDRGVHDPTQFRHGIAAIERVFHAFEQNERITVHGDYDADGVTGSTLLITTLREIEKRLRPDQESIVDFYIPHRDKEGYGLHRDTVPKLQERNTKLIITVDCGIACVDEIKFAKDQAIDTIVVDHHQFGEQLPDGFLIHPGLPEETYPFKHLAAVGVAFKFATALLAEARKRGLNIPEGWEKWQLDLVAIATITDMVPLIGENRVLETYGLRVLNKTRRVGLLALIEAAGLEVGKLDSESVGFALGPRINAAGRMDHATLALRLLLSESQDEARLLAQELEGRNRERQETTRSMMVEADKMIADLTEIPSVLVLWNKEWSPALVGLVAGRFLERYARPAVVVGQHEGKWIGSGRSISSYDITEAVRSSGEGILTRSGGHVQACGFALEDEHRLSDFADRLRAHASGQLKREDLIPRLDIEVELPLDQLNWPLIETIHKFAPFGQGNVRPMFLSRGCRVVSADVIGSQKNHLRLTLLAPNGVRIKAIGFKMGEHLSSLALGGQVDLVYHVDINEWNGRREIQCKLIDLKVCDASLKQTEARAETQVPQGLA